MKLKSTIIICLLIFAAELFSGEAVVIPVHKIQKAVKKYLDAQFESSGMRYEVEWVKEVKEIQLPKAADKITVSHKSQGILKGNRVLKISFSANSHLLRSVYLPVKIHPFGYVWVTQFALKRNDVLSISKIRLEEKDLSGISGTVLKKSAGGVNLILKKNVPANYVLLERDVRPDYLVRKGSALDVAVSRGNLKVSIQTTAMQNGSRDEVIWVKNSRNNKRIKVKIIGPKMAVLP